MSTWEKMKAKPAYVEVTLEITLLDCVIPAIGSGDHFRTVKTVWHVVLYKTLSDLATSPSLE